MADRLRLFTKILKAELEDLSEDFLVIETKYKDRFDRQEIGNYVYKENEALLVHESECVRFVLKRLDSLDLPSFPTIDALIDNIRLDVKNLVKKFEYPEAVFGFISRKIDKVKIYVDNWTA